MHICETKDLSYNESSHLGNVILLNANNIAFAKKIPGTIVKDLWGLGAYPFLMALMNYTFILYSISTLICAG